MKEQKSRPNDQPDWNVCRAWRRMFIALTYPEWDPATPLLCFIDETVGQIQSNLDPRTTARIENHLISARESLLVGRFYEAYLDALEARALAEGITGPERIEEAGVPLCANIRRVYPHAPVGFEKIGRSSRWE